MDIHLTRVLQKDKYILAQRPFEIHTDIFHEFFNFPYKDSFIILLNILIKEIFTILYTENLNGILNSIHRCIYNLSLNNIHKSTLKTTCNIGKQAFLTLLQSQGKNMH